MLLNKKQVKMDDIEKQWKKGDETEELEEEYERQQKIQQKMKPSINFDNPSEVILLLLLLINYKTYPLL
jgi:hypothetical protein